MAMELPALIERLEAISESLNDWENPITGKADIDEAIRQLRQAAIERAEVLEATAYWRRAFHGLYRMKEIPGRGAGPMECSCPVCRGKGGER